MVLNALLDRNVDLNKQDRRGETALHVAIVHEHKEIIEMLINHRDINLRLQNDDGLTPFATALRFACFFTMKNIYNFFKNYNFLF